jgi:hypothetical protein
MKELDREVIDYYAQDLVEMAARLSCSWLLLQDACLSERKVDLARVFAAAHLPHIHSAAEAILSGDAIPLEVRQTVLATEF